ncbi:MAG: SPOR domain-containing protein [candidate division Zixibacteria bacterium]|nr:SPOR domain-containing protein [candidate division Zixibacteria bacterium]
MKLHWIALILLTLVLLVGCSEDSKKEAAKLEQEMTGEQAGADTAAAAVEDTLGEISKPIDAGAVPEEEEEVFIPSQPAGSGYTIQVASCESMEYAQHLIEIYTQRGYEPYMTRVEVGGQLYYRVRIGNFQAKSDALSLKAELMDKYSIQAWVDYNE